MSDDREVRTGGLDPVPAELWRLLAFSESGKEIVVANQGTFDEFVLSDWFHLERMGGNLWWLRVADARLLVEIEADGSTRLTVEREFYSSVSPSADASAS